MAHLILTKVSCNIVEILHFSHHTSTVCLGGAFFLSRMMNEDMMDGQLHLRQVRGKGIPLLSTYKGN